VLLPGYDENDGLFDTSRAVRIVHAQTRPVDRPHDQRIFAGAGSNPAVLTASRACR